MISWLINQFFIPFFFLVAFFMEMNHSSLYVIIQGLSDFTLKTFHSKTFQICASQDWRFRFTPGQKQTIILMSPDIITLESNMVNMVTMVNMVNMNVVNMVNMVHLYV